MAYFLDLSHFLMAKTEITLRIQALFFDLKDTVLYKLFHNIYLCQNSLNYKLNISSMILTRKTIFNK